MPINVFADNNSNNFEISIVTTLFVQKPYLRINYIESNIEEDIDLKNQYRSRNLLDPISVREAASQKYVENNFNDPSMLKNTAHVDFNDKNLNNLHSIKVHSLPTLEEQLIPKYYVDNAIFDGVDESSVLRLHPDEKSNLAEQDSIVLNSTLTSPKTTIIKLPTKLYVDKKFNELIIIENTAHVDFNDENFDNVRFVIVNSMPAVGKHSTAK